MLDEAKRDIPEVDDFGVPGWSYQCGSCGFKADRTNDDYGCISCGRQTMLIQLSCSVGSAEKLANEILETDDHSLWRYRRLIPVPDHFRSHLKVGMTPLLHIGTWAGFDLHIKDETRMPSCSIKDRASEVVLARGRQTGCTHAIVASTGNAAASLSCLGAAHGVSVDVFVPETVPKGKLRQIYAHGANVDMSAKDYAESLRLVQANSTNNKTIDRTTGINPFTREGKKTCAFEIAEQLNWVCPDWVVVSVGDGNILSALWKGFHELHTIGLTSALPRLLCVQSTAAPAVHGQLPPNLQIVRSLEDRCMNGILAESIYVTEPQDVFLAAIAVESSNGLSVLVDDQEIRKAQRDAGVSLGIFSEPSSAAAFAGARIAARNGLIGKGEKVVVINTGHGLKTCGT